MNYLRAFGTGILLCVAIALPHTFAQKKGGGGSTSKPQPKSKTTLKVTQNTGDFIQWVNDITITEPQLVTFFTTTNEPNASKAKFEVSTAPWPNWQSPQTISPNIVDSGLLKGSGVGQFDIDFKKFVPAKPPPVSDAIRYYVRVISLNARGAPLGLPSPAVRVTYHEYTGKPTKIEDYEKVPSSLFKPLPIVIDLDIFRCLEAQEDSVASDGDEPYLFVVAIFADGTTIDPFNFPNSSVRLKSPLKTHGNLNIDGVDTGYGNYPIPNGTGHFETTILPIGLNILDLIPAGKKVETVTKAAMVGILVVAMEEDDNSRYSANAGRNALVSNLRKELNKIIHNLKLSTDSQLDPDKLVHDLKDKLTDKVEEAMFQASLTNLWGTLGAIADKDDYIAAQFQSFTYGEIWGAGKPGKSISMSFKGDGAYYSITGGISVK